jgi:L-threonylcarbamoyladenylate synthase
MTRTAFSPAVEVSVQQVVSWLESGATVVLPTETVYGLAVTPGNPEALARVYQLKGRPSDMNLPVVVGEIQQLAALGVDFNHTAEILAKRFWPGPLTLVMGFSKDRERPRWLEGRVEVAVRFPAHDLLRNIAVSAGPFLLTSANGHGTGPKRDAHEAATSLHGAADHVIDAGLLLPTPSTIINVRFAPAVIERKGAITMSELQQFVDAGMVAPE